MSKKIVLTGLFCLFFVLGIGWYLTYNPGNTVSVVLTPTGFQPSEISIKPGDTVIFTTEQKNPFWPASDLHPTHGIYPEFDPLEPIDPGGQWMFTFHKKGKWRYHDHLNPFFRGEIQVE